MSNNGWLLVALAVIFVYIPARSLYQFFHKQRKKDYFLLIFQYLAFITVLLVFIFQTGVPYKAIGFKNPILNKHSVLMIFICCTAVLGADVLSLCIYKMQQKKRSRLSSVNLANTNMEEKDSNRLVLFLFIAAIWEEMAYRGVLFYWGGILHINPLLILILTSAYFGFIHISNGFQQCYYSFFFGIIFGGLYLITHSLLGVILAHFAGNLFAIYIAGPAIIKYKQRRIIF